jgi:hypothetical protein
MLEILSRGRHRPLFNGFKKQRKARRQDRRAKLLCKIDAGTSYSAASA